MSWRLDSSTNGCDSVERNLRNEAPARTVCTERSNKDSEKRGRAVSVT
jgi:hypothetical protein